MPNAGNSGTGSGSSSSGASAGRGGGDGPNGERGGGGDGQSAEQRRARAAARARSQRAQKYKALNSKDVKANIQNHWETMQQWRIDEGKNFARTRGQQVSRMAGGGMKAGSEQWEANLATIDVAHEAELQSFNDSATMGILNKWAADVKANAPQTETKNEDGTTSYANAVDARSTEDLLTANFGLTKDYSVHTDASGNRAAAAQVEGARQNAARSQVEQASPWWA